jgi:hypothetical protein
MTDPLLPRGELLQLAPRDGAYDDVVSRARRRKARPVTGGALALAAVAVAGTALLLPGGGDDDRLLDRATSTASQSAVPTAEPTAVPTTEPTAEPSAGPGVTAEPTRPPSALAPSSVDPAETYYVQSPSGNVLCSLSAVVAVCEVSRRDYEPPPRPTDCGLDWGYMAEVRLGSPGRMLCASDTGFGPDHPVLAYGTSVTNGVFTCRSTTSSLGCSDVDGDHGIELSRSRYRLY